MVRSASRFISMYRDGTKGRKMSSAESSTNVARPAASAAGLEAAKARKMLRASWS